MPVLVFLLIGAVWAAFLLPSFFESRRRAPMSATRSFQRSTELLGAVAATDARQITARRRQAARRRRLLLVLTFGAAATLGVALWTGSMVWLGATMVFDLLIGAYVTLLLMSRQRAYAVAAAPRIGAAEPVSAAASTAASTAASAASAAAATTLRDASQPATVRVVAG